MFSKLIATLGLFLAGPVAFGQTAVPSGTYTAPAVAGASDKPNGSAYESNTQIGANRTDNNAVQGQPDGQTAAYSLKWDGKISVKSSKQTEWTTTGNISELYTRTPVLPVFVKSDDQLKIESIYYYFMSSPSWLGFYGRVAADTKIFDTYDVRNDEVTYVVAKQNGDVKTVVDDRLKLSSGFHPLTMKESLGLAARPLEENWLKTEIRVGAGGLQSVGKGVLTTSADDKETEGTVEVAEQGYASAVGAETALLLSGNLVDDRISYGIKAETLTPFKRSPKPEGDDRSAKDMTRTEFEGKVGLNLTSWSALSYAVKSKRDPAIADEAEVVKTLLLTVAHKIGGAF